MRSLFNSIALFLKRILASVFGSAFGSPQMSLLAILKSIFQQKLLRINSHVPWPVHPSTRVVAPQRIVRGDRFPGLSAGCHIDGRNGIVIGTNVWIGPRVTLVSMNHDSCCFTNYIESMPIEIGSNSWLGANVIILPSVVLGEHTVVAAGAVVTKSFPESDQVLAGNPARIIKRLLPYRSNNKKI